LFATGWDINKILFYKIQEMSLLLYLGMYCSIEMTRRKRKCSRPCIQTKVNPKQL
jgi:hypothetical protein